MKMAARALPGRSARVENDDSFSGRKNGEFHIFEGGGDDGRDLAPRLNVLRRFVGALAERSIRVVILELESEDFECEAGERLIVPPIANECANAGTKLGQFGIGAQSGFIWMAGFPQQPLGNMTWEIAGSTRTHVCERQFL
jgi:hypothetical protein